MSLLERTSNEFTNKALNKMHFFFFTLPFPSFSFFLFSFSIITELYANYWVSRKHTYKKYVRNSWTLVSQHEFLELIINNISHNIHYKYTGIDSSSTNNELSWLTLSYQATLFQIENNICYFFIKATSIKIY